MWFTNVAAPPWLSKSQSVHTMSEPYPPSDVRPFSTLGCTQRRYATIARVSVGANTWTVMVEMGVSTTVVVMMMHAASIRLRLTAGGHDADGLLVM